MRSAVRRAAPLAYQHSRIIFPITRSACTETVSLEPARCYLPDPPPALLLTLGKCPQAPLPLGLASP